MDQTSVEGVLVKILKETCNTLRVIKDAIKECGTNESLVVEGGEIIPAETLSGMRQRESQRLKLLLEVLDNIPICLDLMPDLLAELGELAESTAVFSEIGAGWIQHTVKELAERSSEPVAG